MYIISAKKGVLNYTFFEILFASFDDLVPLPKRMDITNIQLPWQLTQEACRKRMLGSCRGKDKQR